MLIPEIETHKQLIPYKKRNTTEYIIVHCSATENKKQYDWKTIDQMHRQKGWLGIGYHFVIKTDGTIQEGRPIDSVGAHCADQEMNFKAIGICLIGGVDKKGTPENNYTEDQMRSLRKLLNYLALSYENILYVMGHRDVQGVNKACPCFDVIPWYKYPKIREFQDTEEFWSQVNMSKHDFYALNGDPKEGERVICAC